jgi:site-specific DNA recombinase
MGQEDWGEGKRSSMMAIPVRVMKRAPRVEVGIVGVLYARVSSKEQREEGYSIEAQVRLLREYAVKQRITMVEEFIDVESASRSGRTGFNEMITYMRKHPSCRTILVEKTDRLYRNMRDYAALDVKEMGVEIHLVKEGEVLSANSNSNEQFIHGIRVLMARNYAQNLGEETKKGQAEKARTGVYPSYAPFGYLNVDGPDEKRIIVPDPDGASVVRRLFELFASGDYSLKELVARARADGLTIRGKRIQKSTLHLILRRRIYSGDFDFDSQTYRGAYEPLVSREVWERVQAILDSHGQTNRHPIRHDFAFSGLVRCGHCGCMLVAEIKKGRYVYYHCTGHRGKCPEPYTREERLIDGFAVHLGELVIPTEVIGWLQATYIQSETTERAARERAIRQHQIQLDNLERRINTLYTDRLDGRIDAAMYDSRAAEYRAQQQTVRRRIEDVRTSAPAPVEDALNLIRLTSKAAALFLERDGQEQRRLIRTLVRTAAWQGGELRLEFEDPFEILRGSNRASFRKQNQEARSGNDSKIWLPGMDSNHDSRLQRPLSYH